MYYITLDTNTWIYLANGTEPVRLLHFIKEEVENGHIVILLPEIIINEWHSNKENSVQKGGMTHYQKITESFDSLLKLLGDRENQANIFRFLFDERDDDDTFKDHVEKFKRKKIQIENAVSENIKLIENLFSHTSTVIIEATDNLFRKAGDFALAKKAPFGFKNSFADALILFSFHNYVKNQKIEGAMFITYNTKDFCQEKNTKKVLHSDIEPFFIETKSKFFTIVGEAINTIKDLVSLEELEFIKAMQDEGVQEDDRPIEYCEDCKGNGHGHEIYFKNKPNDVIDERYGKNYENLEQIALEFMKTYPIKKIDRKLFTSIEVGHCSWCNAEHFKCVSCNTVNLVEDLDVRIDCQKCDLPYYVCQYEEDETTYRILKDIIGCQECNIEFENDGREEDLCDNCGEKNYIFN